MDRAARRSRPPDLIDNVARQSVAQTRRHSNEQRVPGPSRTSRGPRRGGRATGSHQNPLLRAIRAAGAILGVLLLPRRRAPKGNYHRYRQAPNPLLTPARVLVQILLIGLLVWLLARHYTQPAVRHPAEPIFKPVMPPSGPVRIDGAPSISADRVNGILAAYRSPLRGHGESILALSKKYGIDDAVALAFFVMESRAGTQGEAVTTHSFGNLRPMPGEPSRDGYRYYNTWMDGATEWFGLMRDLYINQLNLHTVADVIPIYAPSTDRNDPPSMTAGILQLVACWRGDVARCPSDPPAVPTVIAASR